MICGWLTIAVYLQKKSIAGLFLKDHPASGSRETMMRRFNIWWDGQIVGHLTPNQHGELEFA